MGCVPYGNCSCVVFTLFHEAKNIAERDLAALRGKGAREGAKLRDLQHKDQHIKELTEALAAEKQKVKYYMDKEALQKERRMQKVGQEDKVAGSVNVVCPVQVGVHVRMRNELRLTMTAVPDTVPDKGHMSYSALYTLLSMS